MKKLPHRDQGLRLDHRFQSQEAKSAVEGPK